MTFNEVLKKFRTESFTEKDKGTQFERLMKSWLFTDPRYTQLTNIWLWEEFPSRKDFGGKDIGIDLVAKTELGDYWAIQCKCYKETTVIDKPAVDSFLATSSKTFLEVETLQTRKFSARLWISTTDKWGSTAEEALRNQDPPVNRVGLVDLDASPVEWDKLLQGLEGKEALSEGKKPMHHQLVAISKAAEHYKTYDRGKLIMACGTGKTYTSLVMVETLLGQRGLVLFMVPSISLLGQSLNAWASDAKKPIKAVCICSDSRASRKIQKELDLITDAPIDLAVPACTDSRSIVRQLKGYRNHDGLVVVFSTYQSIDAVAESQRELLKSTEGEYGVFDFIICDEAHRTTGVKVSNADESNFTKIHTNEYVQGKKRLYMTATPRLYGESAKIKASEKDCILCSMDDESLYGKEFYRVNFAYAVANGLLTDYKVLVLTVNEEDIPKNLLSEIKMGLRTELNYDDTAKLIGVINGLSKIIRGDEGRTWEADPCKMKRALAFCSAIGDASKPGTSKNVSAIMPEISKKYKEQIENEDERKRVVDISTKHIDGSMNSSERNEILSWLKEDGADGECKIVTNVRCLSEGVDVPALDAVLFLSSRNSQVDVVQSVGRVMRNFRKGRPDEKRYGYIIIPVVVPQDVKPEDALNDNKYFKVVWDILNALRSHDDQFNAEVQKLSLNKKKEGKVTVGGAGIGHSALTHGDDQDEADAKVLQDSEVARQLELRFGELKDGIYAKLVEKCGDRMYWENWAKEVGLIAQKFIERITRLIVKEGKYKAEFKNYLDGLRKNINPSVDSEQAIEMLAQHMITKPVFDALFSDYEFVKNNTVSRSMQSMIDVLKEEAFDKDTEVLDKFYTSVKINVGNIDNLEGKQTVIKNLYEKFFKGAFPKTVDKLGIVYTPVECVDFIIRSVNELLKSEFDTSLTEENVHILDPFTGTGTFITRLLQSGLIRPEDMERKYRNEIHCNEIVLLAYYIADVNIESVFHDLVKRDKYLPYDGICLTDTFQLNEEGNRDIFSQLFQENSERVIKQKKAPVRVIIGNPPYSVGQKSANENAQNLSYPLLDSRISETYVRETENKGKTVQSLYDSYIKAFRWASDRISQSEEGGIIAFISNGAWIDSSAGEGFRKTLNKEFSSVWVFNLRGNQRTQGELSRKEGGKIFGSGSRTPIAITILVKNPAKKGKAEIHYYDIGDYLTREQKLKIIRDFKSIKSRKMEWEIIEPNKKGDWINQRGDEFDNLIPLAPEKKFDTKSQSVFCTNTNGDITHRDVWCYGSSRINLENRIERCIDFYNDEVARCSACKNMSEFMSIVDLSPEKIKWDDKLYTHAYNGVLHSVSEGEFRVSHYRPFFKQHLFYDNSFNWSKYQLPKVLPKTDSENFMICVSGAGVNKPFSCLITEYTPDLEFIGKSQCFPLYWYEENKNQQGTLFDIGSEDKFIRRDGISDWILKEVRSRFGNTKSLTKEHIFYYVYGLLHSEQYRSKFSAELKKSLPRIPIVERAEDFMGFYKAGKELADLHLNYEEVPACPEVMVNGDNPSGDSYAFYSVQKMRFPAKGQKDTIIYNGHIRITNIPTKAYEYVVNGKSAIEWIMERYQVTVDDGKNGSMIKNDPNDWSREHNKPRYILDLLLSVINVSIKTVDIVNRLPQINI